MSDMQFVVEGKNEASKILQDVQRDALNLANALTKMQSQTVTATNRSEVALKGVSNASNNVSQATGFLAQNAGKLALFGGLAAGAYAVVQSIRSMNDFVTSSIDTFIRAEAASTSFENALQLQRTMNDEVAASLGYATASTSQATQETEAAAVAHLQLASNIEKLIAVKEQETASLMTTAVQYGVQQSQLEQVTKAAYGLSAAFGISASEGLTKARQAIDGNFESFERLIPGINQLATEQQKLDAINRLAADGFAQLEAKSQSTEGQAKRAANAWDEFSKQVGGAFEPLRAFANEALATFWVNAANAITPVAETIRQSLQSMQPVFDGLVDGIAYFGTVAAIYLESYASVAQAVAEQIFGTANYYDAFGKFIESTMRWLAENVIAAITFMEVGYTNFSASLELVATSVQLRMTQIADIIRYYQTEVIPAYLVWFGDNWLTAFQDLFAGTMTIVTNLGKNLGEAVFAIFDWINNGFEGGFDGLMQKLGEGMYVNLLDGFEAQSQPLPEILERQISAEETRLREHMGTLADGLANEYNTKLEGRLKQLDETLNSEVSIGDFSLQLGTGIGEQVAKVTKDINDKSLQAVESRLLTRGEVENVQGRIEQNTREAADALKRLADALKKPDLPPQIDKLIFAEVA